MRRTSQELDRIEKSSVTDGVRILFIGAVRPARSVLSVVLFEIFDDRAELISESAARSAHSIMDCRFAAWKPSG